MSAPLDPFEAMHPSPETHDRAALEQALEALQEDIRLWAILPPAHQKAINPKNLAAMISCVEKIEACFEHVSPRVMLNFEDILGPARELRSALEARRENLEPVRRGPKVQSGKRMALVYCLSWLETRGMDYGLGRDGYLARFTAAMWFRATQETTEPNAWGAMMEEMIREDGLHPISENQPK